MMNDRVCLHHIWHKFQYRDGIVVVWMYICGVWDQGYTRQDHPTNFTCQSVQTVAEQWLELAGLQLHCVQTPPTPTTGSSEHTWAQQPAPHLGHNGTPFTIQSDRNADTPPNLCSNERKHKQETSHVPDASVVVQAVYIYVCCWGRCRHRDGSWANRYEIDALAVSFD